MLARRLMMNSGGGKPKGNSWIPIPEAQYLIGTIPYNVNVTNAGVTSSNAFTTSGATAGGLWTGSRTIFNKPYPSSNGEILLFGVDIYQSNDLAFNAATGAAINGSPLPILVQYGGANSATVVYDCLSWIGPTTKTVGGVRTTYAGSYGNYYSGPYKVIPNNSNDVIPVMTANVVSLSASGLGSSASSQNNQGLYSGYSTITVSGVPLNSNMISPPPSVYQAAYDAINSGVSDGQKRQVSVSTLPPASTYLVKVNWSGYPEPAIGQTFTWPNPFTTAAGWTSPVTTSTMYQVNFNPHVAGTYYSFGSICIYTPSTGGIKCGMTGTNDQTIDGAMAVISGDALYYTEMGTEAENCLWLNPPTSFFRANGSNASTIVAGNTYTSNPAAIYASTVPLVFAFDGANTNPVSLSIGYQLPLNDFTISRNAYFAPSGTNFLRDGAVYVPGRLTIVEECIIPSSSYIPIGFPNATSGAGGALVGYRKLTRSTVGVLYLEDDTATFDGFSTTVTSKVQPVAMSGDSPAAGAVLSYWDASGWGTSYATMNGTSTEVVYLNTYANLPAGVAPSAVYGGATSGFLPLEDGDYFVGGYANVTDATTGFKNSYVFVLDSSLSALTVVPGPAQETALTISGAMSFMHAGAIAISTSSGDWITFDKGDTWTAISSSNAPMDATTYNQPLFAI